MLQACYLLSSQTSLMPVKQPLCINYLCTLELEGVVGEVGEEDFVCLVMNIAKYDFRDPTPVVYIGSRME